VDHNGHKLENLPIGNFELKVVIEHCCSKNVIQGFFPAVKVSDLSFKDNKDGSIQIIYKPKEAGLHSIKIHINHIPIYGSPHKAYCVGKETLETSIVFVSQHSECQSIPVLKLYNKTPIRKRTPPREKPSHKEFLTSLEHETTHQYSMCMAYGGLQQWTLQSNNAVSVHLSCGNEVTVFCPIEVYTLGQGFHFVILQYYSTVEVPHFVFSSCPSCQSVMKIYFEDGSCSFGPAKIASQISLFR